MPPKKKGHTLVGKQKVFRHAVEHVRLGLGHTVLGNLSLGLAASSTSAAGGSSTAGRPAFYLELNEQLLSHTSKDFKKFRWEVLELCETDSLFQLHHRQLAQKLLACLIDRGTHRADETADESIGSKKAKPVLVQQQPGDGSTTQAYEAFARLTIAFVRDMGSKFLPYFQIFQQAVQAGIYDHSGHMIVDTARLQLVFTVQAAWCRELRDCWADPAHTALVRRVVQQYVGQLHDTKEYVRRLSAELLAFLCRLSRQLLPLVVEEACGDVLRSYEETATATATTAAAAAAAAERDGDEASSRDSASEHDGDKEVSEEENSDGQKFVNTALVAGIWVNNALLLDFVRTTLPNHPVVDGLTYFIAELFRGVRGSLSSSFETHHVRLLHAFQMLTLQGGDVGEARSSVDVVQRLHELRHPLVPFLDAVSEEDEALQHTRKQRSADLHSTRWSAVFGVSNHSEGEEEGATVHSVSDVHGAQYLLRSIGSLALGSAAAIVLRETKKHSALPQQDSSDENELDDSALAEVPEGSGAVSAVGSANMRPSHRILAAAVLSLDSTSLSPLGPQYIHFLTAVMGSVNFALWVDSRESALLKRLAAQLLAVLRQRHSRVSFDATTATENAEADATCLLEVAAATLGLLSPLCLSPYLGSSAGAGADASSYLLQLQQWFVPVAKAAVQVCVKAAAKASPSITQCHRTEEAHQILFAFVQDVLQKNYAFALEQERRIAEEADARDLAGREGGARRAGSIADLDDTREDAYISEDDNDADENDEGGAYAAKRALQRREHLRIPSSLTPFALTLLHTIGLVLCQGATADVRELRSAATNVAAVLTPSDEAMITALRHSNVRRAVLLSRLLQDHTQHMVVSPLQQLLRLKSMPSASVKASHTKGNSIAAETSQEVSIRDVLEMMSLELLRYYKATQRFAPSSIVSEAMAYVSCALPPIQLLVSTTVATSSSSSPVRTALLNLLQSIEEQDQENAKSSQPAVRTAALTSSLVRATALDPAVYALYAEVAAMLVQLTAGPSARSSTKLLKKVAKKRQHTVEDAVCDDSTICYGDQEGLHHLCRTVAVLAHGFQQLRAATSSCGASGGSSSRNNLADENTEFAAATAAVTDEARVQLLHGAEVLLHALLWMLSLDANSHLCEDNAGTGVAAFMPMCGKPAHAAELLPAHTRTALRTLRAALPSALHRAFVQDVLLECLAAPIPGLRLLALRLLRLVCHPSLDTADRFTDAPAVPLDLIDALLRAAHFNPLSHTGKLDGMRQELSHLTYQVESGVITQPFHRKLIAHTMIGFLYMKFAGAWAIASKVLCSLVALEQTSLPNVKDLDDDGHNTEEGRDEQGDEETLIASTSSTSLATPAQHHESKRRRRLEPVVWNSVVCVYARALIMGDVVATSRVNSSAEVVPLRSGEHMVADDTDDAAAAIISCQAQLAGLPCLYGIHLSDQQRHAKGELVSRVFSSTQYSTAAVTLLNSTKSDYEVVRWEQHWVASQRYMNNSGSTTMAATSRKQQHINATTAALDATSTDRSTLAETFLSIMEAMVKSSSAIDCKVRLVEDVVLELVAVEQNRHPGGINSSQLRKFDKRLEAAMRACATAPSGVLTAHQRKRVAAAVQCDIDARNAQLQGIFLAYLSEANPRLQRVAVDNLKRLRVEPFHTYHAQLIPYCDSMKNLFAFLSTFHVESDVPAHDVVAYVSSALSLALPKLLTKVSKKKLKDQAVLSRRLMNYLEHLTPSVAMNSSAGAAKDPLAEVFDQLLHRLLSFAMPVSTTSAPVAAGGASAYDFLTNVWMDIVYGGCNVSPAKEASGGARGMATVSEPRRRTSHHGVRRLERFMKQLGRALRLLEVMLHAVGQRFSVYVSTCLHVALQAYLVACKQLLRAPLDDLLTSLTSHQVTAQEEGVRRWAALLSKSLANSAISTSMAHVRRAAMTTVALLFEQFPEDVMGVLRGRSDASVCGSGGAVGNDAATPALPLFTRYLNMLFENSKGTTLDCGSGTLVISASRRGVAAGTKSAVTPVLRLLRAWVRSPTLLPLFSAYASIAVGTLEEVFAMNHNATSVHRASPQALNEGLHCVSELLSYADEQVKELPAVSLVAASNKGGVCRGRLPEVTTFRQSFLEQHIMAIFTSLYTLLTSGAAREEEAAAMSTGSVEAVVARAEQRKPSRSGKPIRTASPKGRQNARNRERPTAIMSLSVPIWRELMRTIAQLSRFLRVDSATSTSESSLSSMMSHLLELALKMVTHPVCITDSSTTQMVTSIAQALMEQVAEVDCRAHWQPLVRLFNLVASPHARHTLCAMLSVAVSKLTLPGSPLSVSPSQVVWFRRQLTAAARAVACLNSFESDETFERYDFELRYHTLRSLHSFFAHFGNYGALHRGSSSNGESDTSGVRKVRAYDGAEDVQLPLDKEHAPVLAAEAVAVLAANILFFLRDPEPTIRALVLPLLHSMVRYASLGGQRGSGGAALTEQQLAYRTQLLESTLRHEVLASLRRGVVAKDVHIRCAHMQALEGFGRHFSAEFPSFALLYSPNTEQNFYTNVSHVQHRCRLHALAVLRQHAAEMNVRDVLRVFVPFLMSAVKDFAEGKRNQANLTEGRARGYCDAVLLTVSSIAASLPWMAYYRVMSLFLSNASANANLRATMLRGVVQVLNNFSFLDNPPETGGEGAVPSLSATTVAPLDEEREAEDDEVNDADDAVRADLTAKQCEYRRAKVMRTLEADVLPQLYSYMCDKEASKAISGRGAVNQHSITAVRREQEREDAAGTQAKNALLHLPVAMAITKIVKHFPEDRFNVHVDHLLDELIKKLRTKNDKHRESARRIIGAMLQETGPSKLKFVVTKLKDNLAHGYQLHVLGYTVVTLLHQLYEPNSKLLQPSKSSSTAVVTSSHPPTHGATHDPVQEALKGSKKHHRRDNSSPPPLRRQRMEKASDDNDGKSDTNPPPDAEVDPDTAVERAEEALLRELGTATHAGFDYRYGVDCLTEVLNDLLLIFLDDYLGEVGVQKEQVEVMSTMVEVKRNRALQGFAFLGRHCDAATVMEAFLHRITWVLTPPSDTAISAGELHGSARARALLVQEMRSKYRTVSKGGSADLIFVNKVRLLAVRVARSLMANPTMSVEKSFEQVRRLLDQHNRTREEKIAAFEAKDGTRRIRGNAHLILHAADRQSRKEQLDQNYLVAPVPERVDVDFSAQTVLATQQKQKLRVYRGRYGKEVVEAAKNFYREDPVTAVVLDTLDEFLLKFLLSVLKQVLGIGKEKRYSKAAMKLDMLRHHRAQQQKWRIDGEDSTTSEDDEAVQEQEDHVDQAQETHTTRNSEEEGEEEGGAAGTDAVENNEDVDGLGSFAEAQAVAEGDAKHATRQARAETQLATALLAPGSDLTVTFTREHRGLLESLVPAVLTCLQGEGSDAVVANGLDCLLALVSLRPPLDAVNGLQKELFETVTSFIERGSVIKQRAMRLTAAMVAHQKYVVSESNAVQLVKLVRAEVMERNEYMSVSLSLLYAILGKHVHIAEIYDLMDIITELLLHWSAHRVIRRRCILILVRFLLEYRLTPEKFKSHIDLYCRNLDYPELTGRTALLELLDALILRLPAAILREEAPVLLVPLAATVTGSEWVECRWQGGTVLQHLARCAGVDVLVPILSSWLATTQSRATRSMGMQTWAAILPGLAEFYELSADQNGEDEEGDEDAAAAKAQNRAAFQACCAWSVSAVLDGCMFDQLAASRRNKQLNQLSAKSREKVELEGWAYIFYSLRAAETMLTALPHELYPLLAPRLLPHIIEVLLLHTHPWVCAVAMRVLRNYLYTYVERHCRYLQEDAWQEWTCQQAGSDTTEDDATASKGCGNVSLVFVMEAANTPSKAAVAQALQTLHVFFSLVKRLLGLVSTSDVAMETYNAHRAIANPTRSELLKVAIYVLRAQTQLALFALTRAAAAGRHRYYRDVQQRVRIMYTSLQHQLCSLTSPVVHQESLVNYMVRSTTLLQLFGGWMSVLPHEMADTPTDREELHLDDGIYNAQVRWLTQTQLCPAALLRKCVVPLLGLGLRAKPISEEISLVAFQVTGVVVQQLEERRHELTALGRASESMEKNDDEAPLGKKRPRSATALDAVDVSDEADEATGCVPLDAVLATLNMQLANINVARRDQQVTQNAKKALKRSRRQMVLEERKQTQQSRCRTASSQRGRKEAPVVKNTPTTKTYRRSA
ncbi:putative Down-regulated in metastasis [Leishmania naiffi]|uniref:Down-regulated in metastasis n=1 Tax=Leishmania naiffi TaxID=5678 RepID=A0AAW3B790_9TRYP